MRVWCRRASSFVALSLALIASPPAPAAAQSSASQNIAVVVVPEIRTRIEALLATPNVLLATDYYRIDMRFGHSDSGLTATSTSM